MCMSNFAVPSQKDLMNDIAAEIPSQWRTVGIQLGVHTGVLHAIQSGSQAVNFVHLNRC